MPDLIEGM